LNNALRKTIPRWLQPNDAGAKEKPRMNPLNGCTPPTSIAELLTAAPSLPPANMTEASLVPMTSTSVSFLQLAPASSTGTEQQRCVGGWVLVAHMA
jgi:hypothetical protein